MCECFVIRWLPYLAQPACTGVESLSGFGKGVEDNVLPGRSWNARAGRGEGRLPLPRSTRG